MSRSSAVRIFLLVLLFEGVAIAHFPLVAFSQASPGSGGKMRAYIIKEVHHELIMLPRYSLFDWIEFEVNPDNTVTLRGQVRGLTLKADAEAAVKRIEGVTGVVNHIEDLPPSPADDRIRRSIYRTIYAEDGPLFRYAIEVIPSIHIIVNNGHVTLKGVVDSQADSDFAYARARSVPQTFSVKNQLVVEKP
jgi:hyperosmotically inducible periplasmic protein